MNRLRLMFKANPEGATFFLYRGGESADHRPDAEIADDSHESFALDSNGLRKLSHWLAMALAGEEVREISGNMPVRETFFVKASWNK